MGKNGDKKLCLEETASLPLEIESHGTVYEDRYKKIEKIHAVFNGFSKEYFISDFGEKAAILAVNGGRVLLARQYRLLINGLSYEVPGGKIDKDETPKAAACRECLEETGVLCKSLKPLIEYDPDLEYTKNHTHVFYSDDLDGPLIQSSEKHVWLTMNECLEMINKGQISDSLSIITLLAYKIKYTNI
jgi:ADP-ribose pyrophosphatase